jgi:putative ABC transport system substrate-binding protein
VKRREFISLLGGAGLAWPVTGVAQPQGIPVVGLLDQRSPEELIERLRGFRQGLKETGYVEGENVSIEYRWGEFRNDRLPELAAELARRPVAVIAATGGHPVAFAAQAATTTIPIVFVASDDPVRLGLVANIARPGGNLTGINFFSAELTAKRVELLHELLPTAKRIAVLVNPGNPVNVETTVREVELAGRAMGLQIQVLNASTSREINGAFSELGRGTADAIFVGVDPFFNSRRIQLVHLATRLGLPASYPARDFAEAGGLISYGANIVDAWRQVGVYTGRILQGAKPADLPVVQSSKFELVINLQTALILGINVPPMLLARADHVID